MKALNRNTGKELARNLSIASTFFSRTMGLLGRQALSPGEGLLITPCKGAHTFLMKFPIDVVFLDKGNRIIKIVNHLQPYRVTTILTSSISVIELPAGTALSAETVVGNEIVFD